MCRKRPKINSRDGSDAAQTYLVGQTRPSDARFDSSKSEEKSRTNQDNEKHFIHGDW